MSFSPTVPVETYVKGSPYAQLRTQVADFDPTRGFVYGYMYEGASQTLMLSTAQDCIDAGMTVSCEFENDRARLRVKDSTSSYTIDSWEILASELSNDLFNHPTIVASIGLDIGFGDAFTDVFTAIRTAIGNNLTVDAMIDAVEGALTADEAPELSADSINLIVDFYTLYRQGTTAYVSQQYVLKHKTNVSNRWSENVADNGVDNIYTPSQLFSEVTDPYSWVFPMPYRLQFKLSAIPPQPVTPPGFPTLPTPDGYLWGWLKAGSTEITDANNRIGIETSYTLYLWNTEIYLPFTGD